MGVYTAACAPNCFKLGSGSDGAPSYAGAPLRGRSTGSRGRGLWVIAVEKATGQPLQWPPAMRVKDAQPLLFESIMAAGAAEW